VSLIIIFWVLKCLKNERSFFDFDEVVGVKCDVWEIDRSRSGS
jgi:hypothetical protein